MVSEPLNCRIKRYWWYWIAAQVPRIANCKTSISGSNPLVASKVHNALWWAADRQPAFCVCGLFRIAGRAKLKLLHLPTSLTTQMRPPMASTSIRVMYGPSPNPSVLPVPLAW